ncbi:MAG: hypothetical protein JNL43_08950 [Flavobacteriales bacterium]|nr:hypothetical protein [Flavobacteriales bacterium]HRH69956.1 hypothetical protein [Flavobacteriales bacterium]
MRSLLPYILPSVLVLAGGALLLMGIVQGQDLRVLAGAGLAFIAGVVSLLLLRGAIGNRSGLVLGIVFAALALGLAYMNYRSVNAQGPSRSAYTDRLVDMRSSDQVQAPLHRA